MIIDVNSRVRAVTVYRHGALVTRELELAREGAGFPRRLQLVGLPLSLDDSSVRVEVWPASGSDSGRAPIAGDLRVGLSVPGHDPQLAAPSNAELDQATLELGLIRAELEQLTQAVARLARLQPGARARPEKGKAPASSPTSARLELLAFRRERDEQLGERIQAQRERVRVAADRLERLRERERLASTERNTRIHELRKAAILELDRVTGPDLADRVRIQLHYFVPGARWAPAYTVRLDRTMRSASLELRAVVGQATGEDWEGVALTLSTAQPQQWTELPKLESQRLGRRQPTPAKTGWRPPPIGAAELYADFDRGLRPPRQARASTTPPKLATSEVEPLLTDLLDMEGAPPMPALPPGMPPSMPPGMGPDMGPPSYAGGPAASHANAGAMASRSRAGFAGPPQSFPQPAAKSRGGLGALAGAAFGAIGGLAGSGMDMPAPPPEPEPEELELVASRQLLEYGRLHMGDAEDRRRGSLVRLSTTKLYQQLSPLGTLGDPSSAGDRVVERIEAAVARARILETQPAPPEHRWPTSEGGFDYAYVADSPCDLASDGNFHALAIDQRAAETTPRYIAVPRETQDVFRIVALRNPIAAPLLPGPIDVYVAGKFALTSDLKLTPIGGRIELGLGVEQAIKIARNVSFAEDSAGMFKRQLELSHTIAIEISNHLDSAATVEVRERIPVVAEAQADDISVEIEAVEPGWEDWEPKRPDSAELEGGRRWIVEVQANQTRELEVRWVVKIPTNHELVGGNRREV